MLYVLCMVATDVISLVMLILIHEYIRDIYYNYNYICMHVCRLKALLDYTRNSDCVLPSQCKLLTSATADVSSHGDATGSNSSTYTSASKYMYNIKLIISIVNYSSFFLICRHIAWFLTV